MLVGYWKSELLYSSRGVNTKGYISASDLPEGVVFTPLCCGGGEEYFAQEVKEGVITTYFLTDEITAIRAVNE